MYAGCLPLLLQLPFFSVMYRLFLYHSVAGSPNTLLTHRLLAAPLGSSWLGGAGPLSAQGAVFAGLFLLLAAVGMAERPGRPPRGARGPAAPAVPAKAWSPRRHRAVPAQAPAVPAKARAGTARRGRAAAAARQRGSAGSCRSGRWSWPPSCRWPRACTC